MKRNFIALLLLACFSIFPLFCSVPTPDHSPTENSQTEAKESQRQDTHEQYWAELENREESIQKKAPDIRNLFYKTVLLLVSVIGILLGGSYFVKKMTGAKLTGMSSGGSIQLIERKYLSPKCSLWLISVEGVKMAVVEGQNGVSIQKISEEKSIN